MKTSGNFNLVAVSSITAMSLLTAIVTFGVLDSDGRSDSSTVSLGGAVVGFVVAFSLLAGLFKWLQKSDIDHFARQWQAEISALRSKNEELAGQLIRGSSRPEGYVSEVLEHHRLVLARPESYVSRGGTILDLTSDHEQDARGDGGSIDAVPARLYVNFLPTTDSDVDVFYREYAERAGRNPRLEVMGVERTFVGSDERARPALKVTTKGVTHVTITKNPVSENFKLSAFPLLRDDWPDTEKLDSSTVTMTEEEIADSALEKIVDVAVRSAMVVCLHPSLKKVFFFVFEDDEEDFTEEVEALHRCLRSVRFLG